jgi:hypothetical protein
MWRAYTLWVYSDNLHLRTKIFIMRSHHQDQRKFSDDRHRNQFRERQQHDNEYRGQQHWGQQQNNEYRGASNDNNVSGMGWRDRNTHHQEWNRENQGSDPRHEDRNNLTLRSNYENRYYGRDQHNSYQAFDPRQNDRPGQRFDYSPYTNQRGNEGSRMRPNEPSQRRVRRGFGGAIAGRNKNQSNSKPGNTGNNYPDNYNNANQDRPGENFGMGAQRNQYSGSHGNSYQQGYGRGDADMNRDRHIGWDRDYEQYGNEYGSNYGQGYYGGNENEGWNQGSDPYQDDRYNNEREQQQRSDKNPNTRGAYGSSNYGNLPDRGRGGTDYNSTNRYYSRTRDINNIVT